MDQRDVEWRAVGRQLKDARIVGERGGEGTLLLDFGCPTIDKVRDQFQDGRWELELQKIDGLLDIRKG